MNLSSIETLANLVKVGKATVDGIVRDDQGGRHLAVTNNELRIVEHVPLSWRAEESDATCEMFGYRDE